MIKHKQRFETWKPAGYDGVFDWDFLLPAFKGTRCEPMDFDAVVERRGHVLIFETKKQGTPVPKGQAITLTDQWKKGATIFFLDGKSPQDITGLAIYAEGSWKPEVSFGDLPIQPCTPADVIWRSRCWFCWASGEQPPKREDWERELWVWQFDSPAND